MVLKTPDRPSRAAPRTRALSMCERRTAYERRGMSIMFPECFREVTFPSSSDLWAVPADWQRSRPIARRTLAARPSPAWPEAAGLDPFGLWSLGRCQRSSELMIQIRSPGITIPGRSQSTKPCSTVWSEPPFLRPGLRIANAVARSGRHGWPSATVGLPLTVASTMSA